MTRRRDADLAFGEVSSAHVPVTKSSCTPSRHSPFPGLTSSGRGGPVAVTGWGVNPSTSGMHEFAGHGGGTCQCSSAVPVCCTKLCGGSSACTSVTTTVRSERLARPKPTQK